MDQYSFSTHQLLGYLLTCPAAILDKQKRFIDINAVAEQSFFCCSKYGMIGQSLKEHIINFEQANSLLAQHRQCLYFHPTTKKNYHLQLNAFPSAELVQFYIFQAKETIEYEYEELKHNFESVLNNLPGSVYWKDTEGRYLGCNKVVADMAGFDKSADIIGKTDRELCWGEFADEWQAHDRLVMQADKQIVREERARLASGEVIVELTYKMPLKNRFGKLLGIIGTSLDITPLKNMEKELSEANQKGEILNKMKTEFMRNVEHDVRTPFSGLSGLSTIVWEKEENPQNKEFLGFVVESAQEMLNYCNEIVDFSQIESGMHTLQEKKFVLKSLVEGVIKMLRPAAITKNLALTLDYNANITTPVLLGDPRRVQRILMNLLGNAIKFTKEGQVTVKVAALPAKEERSILIRFIVEDTGIGIPEDKQEAIFEKFTRLTLSNTGAYKGIGLGLTVVKQFMHEMDGEIDVISETDRGSTFVCTIPFRCPLSDDFVQEETRRSA